ncbi:uncharacterized protein YALI1_F30459g [Yarrowia lipolytica]|jgi:threonine synthase|uniref:Threonine synthase n=2 Tax=Yarrowia lipolytica TaxID=4952 RepID=A0A1D8NPP5_YARLL|nr:hypothetical protein YALI1_F30459g [Yarrowia lipolytica]QNP99739.1 Threonine synthase [Yarrowia lipolytica]
MHHQPNSQINLFDPRQCYKYLTTMTTYFSTRSSNEPISFEAAVMKGLAPDGGLYIPTSIPKLPSDFLTKWADLSFAELAFEILSLYIPESEISRTDLKELVTRSYSTFRSDEVTPVVELSKEKQLYLLELFHGPTYAFKDVALQFVGNLFEYFLTRKNVGKEGTDRDTLTVVGATSGDTGSAAIYGLRGKKDVSVFILYPTGRVSPIQEDQMTTVSDANVHTISVAGTFDDCQDIVKQVFGDAEFNAKHHVGAVNSINWARILAQITYYFHSFFQVQKKFGTSSAIKYSVPTGNFGDILAGFYARRMGLPIQELTIATNSNDILDRFLKTGSYSKSDGASAEVHATLSPAMDILVSSNFERFLWYVARENVASSDAEAGATLNKWMQSLKTDGVITVDAKVLGAAKSEFSSERVSDEQTLETIKDVFTNISKGYILDPHSSVGVTAALRKLEGTDSVYIALSTAHPAKFSDAVDQALKGLEGYNFERDVLPQEFKDFANKDKKKLFSKADVKEVESIIEEELAKEKKQ